MVLFWYVAAFKKLFVEFRVKRIEVPWIKIFLRDAERFTKTLEVHNFSRTQEFDWFTNIGVFYQAKNVVVGGAGFLFCCTLIYTTKTLSFLFILQIMHDLLPVTHFLQKVNFYFTDAFVCGTLLKRRNCYCAFCFNDLYCCNFR